MYLENHSYCSLRYGTMPVATLVEKAAMLGIETLALTDINNTMGAMDFIRECTERSVRPVAGADFRNGNKHLFTAIARNNEGFREINECITWHNLSETPYETTAPPFQNVYVIYPFGDKPAVKMKDNEFTGVRPSEVSRLISGRWRDKLNRFVIRQPVSFACHNDYDIHLNLRAIDNNVLISHLSRQQVASPHDWLMPPDMLKHYYDLYPELLSNTDRILRDCSVSMDYNTVKNKRTFTGSLYDDRVLLEKLAREGLEYRYGKADRVAAERVRRELDIIDKLGFSAYFLITWDIIRYSMGRGFYHVGRGSGANSIVAYCLRITDVDPVELDLYFERFINPKRTSPPDFDIDYSWRERDEVIDYIFKRHGRKHTALLGATTTFRDKSIVRELGKVHGLPKGEIDDLIREPDKVTNRNGVADKIRALYPLIQDFPNVRSIHAGGILISEEPITCYTALDLPPKGFPTTQWDMYVAEEIGFEKLDILSQRGIGHIRECAELVSRNRGISVDVHKVDAFKKDPLVKERLREGETNGCFYIESPAMRGLLKKLRCDNYLSLVAASSIIRPGVAKSGMMREYICRFHHPDGFKYLHPVMEEQLKETYGVMVYQEDVLKVCHHFAGLDLSDADILRRAMSGKSRSRSEFERIRQKFFDNCKQYGYPDDITAEVWRQIESFAGYSFSKAHSASYAVESYQSLYLKTYYPLEFMTAVINNFGGFYQTWVYFNEARRCGARIQLPCVNRSEYNTTIYGDEIFMGLIHLAGLEREVGKRIVAERKRNGPYTGLADFAERVSPGIEQLILLIRCGILRCTGKSKAMLMWEAHLETSSDRGSQHSELTTQAPLRLFHAPGKQFRMPELAYDPLEDAYDEIELLGFPVSMSWFDLLATPFRGEIMAQELKDNVGKTVRMVGSLVTIKYVRTVHKEWMHFAAFLDAKGEFFDSVHFPNSLREYPFRGYGVYLILGTVTEEFEFPSLNVIKMAKLPFKKDPRRM